MNNANGVTHADGSGIWRRTDGVMQDSKIILLDGSMGTMLQKNGMPAGAIPEILNIEDPQIITAVHRAYIEAGSDVIYTNTFGANRFKLKNTAYTLNEIITAGVKAAKDACENTIEDTAAGRDIKIALSIGPLGQMLEPIGPVKFEEAYDAFKETAAAGEAAGADLIVIETMTDLYELKAAVLASIENTGIPVMCSMSFEENGRTFTGCSVEAFAATIEGLGVEAAGINCSLGPDEIYPLAKKLCEVTNLPVFAKPNAGLPDPATGEYDITAADFTVMMAKYAELGVSAIGGCCGTDPEFIADLSKMLAGKKPVIRKRKQTAKVCSATKVVAMDHVVVCGERLNPTGKKLLKQAMLDGDMDYIAKQAIIQEDEGAEILDVNVGVPGIDEVKVLPAIVKHVQSVTDLPLQIDCSNAEAVEAALRVYNGKAIVNSVNGEETSRRAILPIVRKYGAAVIGLTLDEEGIPETAEKRVEIAEKIQRSCSEIGILDDNIVIDCLTLTVSAQPEGAKQTLEAMRRVKKELGLKTVLGVSNISFGLPHRPVINSAFLTMAIGCGLDIAIIDPGNVPVIDALHTACVLMNIDKNAEKYIARFGNRKEPAKTAVHGSTCAQGEAISAGTAGSGAAGSGDSDKSSIYYCLEKGLGSDARKLISAMLETKDEMSIVNEDLIPALDRIGKNFEAGRIFLPQMMQAAGAAQEGFEVIKANLLEKGEQKISRGKVVIATVKGDIHDIGKNIVKVIMDNYGFEMIDLGKDVDPEAVVEAAIENDVRLVGLSALMTTTLGSMEETIKQLHRAKPDCKVMVGGAVLTAEYSEKIGADYYSKDAMQAVEAAKDALEDADV